jgi:hypothetical protein
MRLSLLLVTALTCTILVGCLGSDDSAEPTEQTASASRCPNGERLQSGGYELNPNPDGEPTPQAAIARFLDQRKATLSVNSFRRVDEPASGTRATFVLGDEDFELVRLHLERFERGWLVVGWTYCTGAL